MQDVQLSADVEALELRCNEPLRSRTTRLYSDKCVWHGSLPYDPLDFLTRVRRLRARTPFARRTRAPCHRHVDVAHCSGGADVRRLDAWECCPIIRARRRLDRLPQRECCEQQGRLGGLSCAATDHSSPGKLRPGRPRLVVAHPWRLRSRGGDNVPCWRRETLVSRAGLLAARRARRRAWRPREALHTLVRACVVAVLCAVLARRFCLFNSLLLAYSWGMITGRRKKEATSVL